MKNLYLDLSLGITEITMMILVIIIISFLVSRLGKQNIHINLTQPQNVYPLFKAIVNDLLDSYAVKLNIEVDIVNSKEFSSDLYEQYRDQFIKDCITILQQNKHILELFGDINILRIFLAYEFDKRFYSKYIDSPIVSDKE